jgi:HEPN domain-containing protein
MSVDKERYEAGRWLDTAREDLDAARSLLESGKFSHSCFFSQQAGEKAVKALYYLLGEDPWVNSIQKLIAELPNPAAFKRLQPLIQDAALLDRYYIPTRYPNGLPDLTPGQAYFRRDAELCLESSHRLLSAVAGFADEADNPE